jgi:hypothetical protein
MTEKKKLSKAETIAKQQRQILDLEAQLAHAYHFAASSIDKASTKYMMASGVLLQLTANGGRELICPVMIKDGLSDETIAAIKADLKRSYELAVMFKP